MATALGTFLIRQGFLGVPSEIRDATRLEGYGHWSYLWRFAVPLTRPVIASFTVISFLGAWNQYLWPRAVVTDSDNWSTIQIALRDLTATPETSNIARRRCARRGRPDRRVADPLLQRRSSRASPPVRSKG